MEENCEDINGYDHDYLFQKMETEREQIPNVLREEYLPVFVVKCLREQMNVGGEPPPTFDMPGEEGTKWTIITKPFIGDADSKIEGPFILSQKNLNFAGKYLKFGKSTLRCLGLNRNKIGRCFTDEFQYPSLELLYLMDNVYQLLPLSTYLMWLKKSSKMNYFKRQFLAFAFSSTAFSFEHRERSMKILQSMLQTIILSYYCNPCSKPDLKTLKENCDDILSHILTNLISKESSFITSTNNRIILSVLKDVDVPRSVRIRFFSDNINNILRSGTKPFHSEQEMLQYQEKYAEPKKMADLEIFTFSLLQMISTLNTNDVFNIISSVLSSSDFNWEMVLLFVNVWMQKTHNFAAPLLKDFSKKLIRDGLLNRREREVAKGFILARHCSSIASETFSRYEKWFANCFDSDMYSLAKETETFSFFVQVLSQWVPVEPSCLLTVHTTYWPFIPKGCKEFWNDYLSMAKVRISEYKEVEAAMEYEPNPNDPVQHEVAMAIKNFEAKGKIPDTIIKMCVFAKQKYLQTFLPELLRKPTNVALTDSRLRLIELLKQDGKIPEDLYMKYKTMHTVPQ